MVGYGFSITSRTVQHGFFNNNQSGETVFKKPFYGNFNAMKKFILLFSFISTGLFAQDLEQFPDDQFSSEFGRYIFTLEVGKDIQQLTQPVCTNFVKKKTDSFTKAEFPGGEQAFKKELFQQILRSIDREAYTINGRFYVLLDVDSNGKLSKVQFGPKVQNGEMLFADLEYAVFNIKSLWSPAKCNGIPVASRQKLALLFTTESYDL